MSDNQLKINSLRKSHSFYNSQELNQFMSEIFSDLSCKPQENFFKDSLIDISEKKTTISFVSKYDFFEEQTVNDRTNLQEVFLPNKKHKSFSQSDDSTDEIRSQLNDITQIYLPKITAHYGVKTLQELQEIDEANRKLLAINGDENSEAKERIINQFEHDQSVSNQALGVVTDNFLQSVKLQNNLITTNSDIEQLNSPNSLPSAHIKALKSTTSLKRISSIKKG
ncbi:hypothetical protein LBMAG18_06500 [Alphaproteobacteria bacterium]|nr:hypothetical protein LBMAG18_06500 [Alphaproteobacteria bacterium]